MQRQAATFELRKRRESRSVVRSVQRRSKCSFPTLRNFGAGAHILSLLRLFSLEYYFFVSINYISFSFFVLNEFNTKLHDNQSVGAAASKYSHGDRCQK